MPLPPDVDAAMRAVPPHGTAASAVLMTSENVAGCLEAALLKLSSSPGWSLADTSFIQRTVPAIVGAARSQLQAAERRRHELLEEAENLRAFAERRLDEVAELKCLTGQQAWYPTHEAHKSQMRLEQARSRAEQLREKLSVATAELRHLQGTVGESLSSEREAVSRRRAEMIRERDSCSEELRETRLRLERAKEHLHMLQVKASCIEGNLQQATREAGMLPRTEAKYREVQAAVTEAQNQLQQMRLAKKKKKKPGKTRKAEEPQPAS